MHTLALSACFMLTSRTLTLSSSAG